MPRVSPVSQPIPKAAISRLPLYLRALVGLEAGRRDVVCSEELGRLVGETPAQVRKDFSHIGHLGVQGRGYSIALLRRRLQEILGLDREWPIVVVGMGNEELRPLMRGSGMSAQFLVRRAYDTDPASFGRRIGGVVVEDIASLGAESFDTPIEIAMVSVAQDDAQQVVDSLVESGVRSILSVGPLAARVPPDVQVHHVDLVVTLETMTYELNQHARDTGVTEPTVIGAAFS